MADRGLVPVVGKALEAGVVVLYVGLVAAVLFGGAVPGYRTAAGDAVADRALAAATERVQAAVPPNATAVDARVRVSLPATIRGEPYAVQVDGRSLVLAHPHPGVGGRLRLALPPAVVDVRGEWHSTAPAVVRVRSVEGGLAVALVEGRR